MPTIEHSIDLACSQQAMYEYISQPWLWHEWHPNSKGATASVSHLAIGDEYIEDFEIQPISLLPIVLQRKLHYRVVAAEPFNYWEVKAKAADGSADIHFIYHFETTEKGVRFTRRLNYQLHGVMKLFSPLIKRANARQSNIAVDNLRQIMNQAGS